MLWPFDSVFQTFCRQLKLPNNLQVNVFIFYIDILRITRYRQLRTGISWQPKENLLPLSLNRVLTLQTSFEQGGIFSSKEVRYKKFNLALLLSYHAIFLAQCIIAIRRKCRWNALDGYWAMVVFKRTLHGSSRRLHWFSKIVKLARGYIGVPIQSCGI